MSSEVLLRALDYVRREVSALTSADLPRPTPCRGWDVDRLLHHLADTTDALSGLVRTGELALPVQPRDGLPDPVAVVRDRLAALDAALASTPDAERVAAAVVPGAVELTGHGWDLGVARDPGHRVPDDLARDVLALATPVLGDPAARGDSFAAPLGTPDGALASERLVAFLGRTPPGGP